MASKNDENLFVKAYNDEGVSFKSFAESKRKTDNCSTSSFSLLREMAHAKEENDSNGLLGSTSPLKDRNSIKSLLSNGISSSNPFGSEKQKINLSDAARPLRNRSSIHSFLTQNVPDELNEAPVEQSVSQFSPAPVAQTANLDSTRRYSNLFKGSGQSDFSEKKNSDSLQDIYKRLLQCQ